MSNVTKISISSLGCVHENTMLHTLIKNVYVFKAPHPQTVLNPNIWNTVDELKITEEGKVLVRNNDSMWFNLEQCKWKQI